MNDRIRRLYEMFLRVLSFMTANAADFADTPFAAEMTTALQAEAATLGALGAAKATTTAAAKDSTVFRGDARQDVRDDLDYLDEIWRSIQDEVGGAANKLKMPSGKNDQALIAGAKSVAAQAETVSDILKANGMPTDFLAGLLAKIDVFERAVNTAEAARGGRVETNAAFADPARRGKNLVERLSPTVKRKYRRNAAKSAGWLVASHVERPPKTAAVPIADDK